MTGPFTFVNSLPRLQKSEARAPFPQINAFRPFIMREITRRKQEYPTSPVMPFVRMTSCQRDPEYNYAFFVLGLHGFEGGDGTDIFDATYGGDRDIVGYAYDMNSVDNTGGHPQRLISAGELSVGTLSPAIADSIGQINPNIAAAITAQRQKLVSAQHKIYAKGTHPVPGIINVDVVRQGLGAPVVMRVDWVCYNRAQLEFLRNHFLVAGNYVVLEWGNQFSTKQPPNLLNFKNVSQATQELVDILEKGRQHTIVNWVEPNEGNYDIMVGSVGNFDMQLDPVTNIYTCTTTLYSTGELLRGINSDQTFVRIDAPTNTPEINYATVIHDFFKLRQGFDKLVESDGATSGHVVLNFANWSKDTNINVQPNDEFSTNAQDYRYVSWTFLMERIIPEIFNMIPDENLKKDLLKFVDFNSFKQSGDNESDWVGYNRFLKSADPSTMILITKEMFAKKEVPAAFMGIGAFDGEDTNGTRGKLSTGVWICTRAIRHAFSSTNDFIGGMNFLLTMMNNATVGYWGLQLFFDEETAQYKVIDNKHTDNKHLPSLWKFNTHGVNLNPEGELLDVKFDSAFPPELVSQMMLVSKLRTMDPVKVKEMMDKYPMLGTTSAFMYALNWTNLEDMVERARKNRQENAPPPQKISMYKTEKTIDPTDAGRLSGAEVVMPKTTAVSSPGYADVLSPTFTFPKPATTLPPVPEELRNSVKPPLSARAEAVIKKYEAANIDEIVKAKAQKYNLDPALLKAIMATETGEKFAASATGPTTKGANARGLMQIMPDTARALGYTGPLSGLYDIETNIDLGAKYLSNQLKRFNGDIPRAISSYNDGQGYIMKNDGYFCPWGLSGGLCQGKPKPSTLGVPMSRSQPWSPAKAGEFGNQHYYVNKTLSYYNMFLAQSNKPAATPTAVSSQNQDQGAWPWHVAPAPTQNPAPSTPPTSQTPTSQPTQNQDDVLADALRADYRNRFGDEFLRLIEVNRSAMINKIARDGYEQYPSPNSFVAPFPTTTKVSVDILGVSGVSIGDAFFVDRLPFIFEKYGCFQTIEVQESISVRGWVTRITGYFKLLWMDGEGPTPVPISSLP